MDFGVLGPLRVSNGDGPIDVPGAKERALLAHLVARRGSMVPATEIIDALWGDEPPRSAAKSVQTFVARLRNALDPERISGTGVIVTEGPGYRLDVDASAVDAERFIGLLTVGRTALRDGRDRVAGEALGDALALWRGPAYAGFDSVPWAQAEARRLEELRLDAADDLLAVRLDLGHTAEVIAEAERRLGEQPLRERIWCLLVLALYRAGRQADALAAYERARSTLADELGVDPGPELRELHAKVLAHDPALRGRGQVVALPEELQAPTDGFVGRAAELGRLRELWASVEAGGSVSVAVRGPEGAGASRLAAELARGAARAGASVSFVGPSTDPSSRMPQGSPALVVADHVVTRPPEHGMLVRLVGAGDPVADADEVIDLKPLGADEIHSLAGKYVPASDLDAAVAEVLGAGTAWPGHVHDAVAQRARRLATQQVASAVRTATVSREALVSARNALSDGVETLAESALSVVGPSDEAPWPGLQPYGEDEARFFAGRERLVAELVARLATTRLLAVVGASGTGKSSLVQAGLVPALEAGVLPGSSSWARLTMRPGSAPLRELARVALGGRQVEVGDVLTHLLSLGGRAEPAASSEDTSPRTLLVVDQFEEAWTSGADEAQVADFLRVLVDAVDDPAGRVSVVVVLRADYLTSVAEHPELAKRLSESTILVGAPTSDEVRRAVERPAERARLVLEDGLADAVVADAGAEPGLLPLLSTSMRRLWEDRTAGMLTFASYVGSGGLRGAIAGLAEDAFTSLPDSQREAARTLLLRLAGPGEGVGVTRRRVALAELEALPSPDQRRVADRLADARLLTISDGHVEVAHEALFREWPRLSGWLAEDATSRAVQRRLTLAANEWDAEGREDAALWRGTRLAGALELVAARPGEVTSVERAFVDAARERAEAEQREVAERAARTARQNRRLRGLLVGAAVLLVIALVAGLLAWRSSAEATASSERATAASISADAKRLAATALNEEYPDVAMLAALESVRIERSPETYGALLTLLSRAPEVLSRTRIEGRFLRQGVSPDGRLVLLVDNGNTLYAHDADTGELRWQVESSGSQFYWPAVSPDGKRIVIQHVGQEPIVEMRSTVDGAVAWSRTLADFDRESPAGPLEDMADGVVWLDPSTLAVGGPTQWLEVDAATGAVKKAHAWDKRLLFISTVRDFGGGRFALEVEEQQTLVVNRARPTDTSQRIDGFVFGDPRNGRAVTLVENGADNTMTLTPLRSTTDLRQASSPVTVDGFAPWASFSPDGSQLILCVENRVEVRDSRTGALRRTFEGHSGTVLQAEVAGSSQNLIWTAGRDGTTVAFDLSASRGTVRPRQVAAPPHFSLGEAVGDVVVGIGSYRDRVNPAHLVDITTGKDLFGELPLGECPEECQAAAVAMGPDGRTAYGTVDHILDMGPGVDGALVAWDVATGRTTATWPTPWPVYALDVAADGRTALLNGRFGWGLMDLSSGELLWESERQAELNWYGLPMATVSPDGRWAVLGRQGSWQALDLRDGRVVATREDADTAASFTWSDDVQTLVVGTMGGRVHFVDPATLRDRAPSRLVVGGFIIDLETSPDGRLFASLGSDGDTMLWDAATQRPFGRPLTGTRMWGTLSFSEDGGTLRVLFDNATRTDIDVRPEDWVRSGCRVAGRDLTPEESAILRPGQPLRSTCDGLT